MLTHNITNWVETLKQLKRRSARSQRKARMPARRWEDDLNEFVKDEEIQTTHSNDLINNNTWLIAAKKDLQGVQ